MAQLSHVFSLQRPIDANARESSFLAYQTVLPLEAAQLAAAGMRSNSVRASVVHKAKKTQGGGQQTTRNSLQDLSASFAAQSVSVAVAMGVARRAFGHASDPGSTIATNLAQFVDGTTASKTGPFVVTSSTRLLPHALPIRIGAHNLLTTMRGFASRELEAGMIRSLVPQQVASLRSICVKICDRADGVNVWAAWVLLIHMLSDPRLRKLVQASPITDHEVSAAYLFTNYARAEVTRRARMDQAANQKRAKTGKAVLREDAEAGPSGGNDEFRQGLRHGVAFAHTPGTDMEGVAEFYAQAAEDGDVDPELARGVKVACEQLGELRGSSAKEQAALQEMADKQTLSLKRKRPPCSGVVQVLGRRSRLLGAALASEYAVDPQDHDHAVAALANQASVETLTGQAPRGSTASATPCWWTSRARNAVKSAEALSGLVVTTPERVPKIVSWRSRNDEGRLRTHTGLVRSSSDASNTTVHARAASPRAAGSTGTPRWLWSLPCATRRRTTRRPAWCPASRKGRAPERGGHRASSSCATTHYTARVSERIKQRTSARVRRRAGRDAHGHRARLPRACAPGSW